jgi:hypothetical protein
MRIFVEGIGLCGPGLTGWVPSLPVLAGHQKYVAAPTAIPAITLLPANERRRAAQIVKIALAVGTEAFAAAGRAPAKTATVFTSSAADGETLHEILNVLASPHRELSPTRFHNSVHNSAAGYWSIATGSTAASTSLCGHDDSFAAGLLEAAVQVVTQQHAVALIAYDAQYPGPLGELRPVGAAFAVALVLSPTPTDAAFAAIELVLQPGTTASSKVASPELEMLNRITPAGRSLPLLAALARRENASITLNYLEDMVLVMNVTPLDAERSMP